jgi:putative FmdB family regulatory protein
MPIYEYKCKDCGHRFALLQSISASRTGATCPNCSSVRTERVISRFGAVSPSCNPKSPFT